MIAVLSDIHANLEALRAVLDDIERQKVEAIYCLGDVVGYGPDPRACLDLVRSFRLIILGNHDQAALFDPIGFSPHAERAIFWTRDQLENSGESREVREQRWEFLSARPLSHKEEGGRLFVHGSARNPLNEYVFPEDIYNQRKMERIFALVERCCFQGHTHVPGVFIEQVPEDVYAFRTPTELDGEYRIGNNKVMVNVGSVGQPRDGDPRSCYILLDGETIRYRRVEYDIEKTVRKIHAADGLERFLGDRLRDGR